MRAMSLTSDISVVIGEGSLMGSQLLAEALRRSRNPRFDIVVPSGFSSTEITQHIIRSTPQVAVISSALRDGSMAGYGVLKAIQQANVPTRSVLVLEERERDLVLDAFRAGARGVFCRSDPSDRLPRCLRSVHHGQIWASSAELNFVLEELSSVRPLRVTDARGHDLLSKREEEVVALVADGLTNRAISERLSLSEHTVKNYLFRIFEKLGISTRVELVLYAVTQTHARESKREHA